VAVFVTGEIIRSSGCWLLALGFRKIFDHALEDLA